jgi:hypothetical protein
VTDDVAAEAFGWIESAPMRDDNLYDGTAGVLLGCAEATAAGLAGPGVGRAPAASGPAGGTGGKETAEAALAAHGGALARVAARSRDRWCHGPTGTMRLFTLLDTIDPQPRWQRATDRCLGALRDSRLPARLYPGYWDNVARCCGTAGVGQVLLDCHHATGDPELLAWSQELAADVLARTVATAHGPTWSNTEHTGTPPDLPPDPGFMQGSAGIAGWLARLAAPASAPVVAWV